MSGFQRRVNLPIFHTVWVTWILLAGYASTQSTSHGTGQSAWYTPRHTPLYTRSSFPDQTSWSTQNSLGSDQPQNRSDVSVNVLPFTTPGPGKRNIETPAKSWKPSSFSSEGIPTSTIIYETVGMNLSKANSSTSPNESLGEDDIYTSRGSNLATMPTLQGPLFETENETAYYQRGSMMENMSSLSQSPSTDDVLGEEMEPFNHSVTNGHGDVNESTVTQATVKSTGGNDFGSPSATVVYGATTTTTARFGRDVSFHTAVDIDSLGPDPTNQTGQVDQAHSTVSGFTTPPPPSSFSNISDDQPHPSDTTRGLMHTKLPEQNASTDQMSDDFEQTSRDASRYNGSLTSDADPVRSNFPGHDYRYIVNSTTMTRNFSEPTQSTQGEEDPLLITKLEDLQKNENGSDVPFNTKEIGLGLTNSSDESAFENASDSTEQSQTESDLSSPAYTSTLSAGITNGTESMDNLPVPEEQCVYDVFGPSGRLVFPDSEHFPVSSSKEFLTCRWRVRVPEGPNIQLSFERLALSMGVEQLEIAVGQDGELQKRTFTGSKTPRDLVTMGTRVWLSARLRNDNYNEKFVLTFHQTDKEAEFPLEKNYTCGGILSDMTGNITSPGFHEPGHYSDNQECSWYIVAPSQSVIKLRVRHFHTDVYDHVTLGVGLHASAPETQLLTLYGHMKEERETVIPANSLWIHFSSDDSETAAGFFISYQVLPRDICNNSDILTQEQGVIMSVHYPGLYPINSECTWYIRAPPGAYVNITFLDLDIQDGHDFVLIGEGKDLLGGPFTTFTGNSTGSNPVRLDSSDVWIHFTSDHLEGDLPYKGFSLVYNIVSHLSVVSEAEREHQGTRSVTSPTTILSPTPMMTTETAKTDMMRPDEEENMVLKDIPMNDQGRSHVLIIPLSGVKDDQLDLKLEEFRSKVAHLINTHCSEQVEKKCRPKLKLKGETIRVVGTRQQQGRLLVEVRIEADVTLPSPPMADADYEELERLFHSDLQSLDLQDEGTDETGSSHLPEWLICVIVVVILLIIAFFVMVVYSVMKERKKNRAGSYGGTTSTASACEDVEVGKADGSIRITAFTLDQTTKDGDAPNANGHATDGSNGATWTLDAEVASTLQRRQHGPAGCMNPAFIDDDKEEEGNDNTDIASSPAKKDEESPAGNGVAQNTASPAGTTESTATHQADLEMKGDHDEGRENGNGSTPGNEAEVTQDKETAVDDGEKEAEEVKGEDEVTGAEVGGSVTDGNSTRQLEVVADREETAEGQACVMVHRDSHTDQGNSDPAQESSTDESGMSTNL